MSLKHSVHGNPRIHKHLRKNKAASLLQHRPSSFVLLIYFLLTPHTQFTHRHVHSSPLRSQSILVGISTQPMRASADCKLISDLNPPVGTEAWLVTALYRSRWPDGMEQICLVKILLRAGKRSQNHTNARGQSLTLHKRIG